MYGYFTISEFAKLCGTSRDTLLYYDKINLLKPFHTATNNYRYYSASQYESFMLINSLKQSNIPLSRIKEQIKNKTPESLSQLLDETETNLTNQINMMTIQRDKIKFEKMELKKAIAQMDKYEIIDFDKIPIIKIKKEMNSIEEIDLAIVERFNYVKQNNISASNHIGFYGDINKLSYDENNAIISLHGSYLSLVNNFDQANFYINGKYLSIYIFTDFIDEKDFIEKTKTFAEKNNIKLSGNFFTASLVGEFFSETKPLLLTKYLFEIKK